VTAPGHGRSIAERWGEARTFLAAQNWAVLAKSQVNPRWVWRVIGAVVVFWAVILGALIARRAAVSRPTATIDRQLAEDTQQRKLTLEEGRRLFAAGRYEESLARFRKVLARSPNNHEARQYAQMAQTALDEQQVAARKKGEADRALQLGQAAFAQGNYEEARRQANQALALDGGSADAQKLREESAAKIEETAAAAARRKAVQARPTPQLARRAPASAPEIRASGAAASRAAGPSAAVTGNGMLRLLFHSPITEGNVMVAVNDQILLRRQFSFKRRESLFKTVKGTGTVDETIPVRSGPINVKVWLSGPEIPASILATTNGQMGGGETRVLHVEYAGGRLSAQVQ
jgi:hypothetical protein